MTERITSARELSKYLVERFRRDGFFRGPRFVDKGELIIPLSATLCQALERLRQSCVKSATLSDSCRDNVADLAAEFARLNCNVDDWQGLSESSLNAERKANRARERALKRSRRNTKNPKKKGKCR